MTVNKTVYTIGNIGNITEIISSLKRDEHVWAYFIYKTGGSKLNIGTFEALKGDKEEAVILGIASSRKLAQKLALHIIVKALEQDCDIESGIKKITEI